MFLYMSTNSRETIKASPPQVIKILANRLRQDSNLRRARLIRYTRLRTHIKGPSAAIAFHSKQAPGTLAICMGCGYYAASPQLVCAPHPDGPPQPLCPDRYPLP